MYQRPIRPNELYGIYMPAIRPTEIYHHGVKGQKWGVRNGPPYPIKKSVAKTKKTDTIKHKVVSEHQSTPRKSEPNSTIDSTGPDGKVYVRTFYDADGYIDYQIHTTDHGNSKEHPYGEHGEHAHDYEWNADGTLKSKKIRNISDAEREENGDIL